MNDAAAGQLRRAWAKAETKNAKITKAQLQHIKPVPKSVSTNAMAMRQWEYNYAVAICDVDGSKPVEQSTFLIEYGDSTYNIPHTHVISSIGSAPLLDAWAATPFAVPKKDVIDYHNEARAPNGCRMVCWFKSNWLRWKRLPQGAPPEGAVEAERIELLPEEECSVEWQIPYKKQQRPVVENRAPCAIDDVIVDTHYKHRLYGYAPIDVFAKYIGHEALMGGADGVPLLLRYFLRLPFDSGSGLPIMYPKDDAMFGKTRTKLLKTFQNIYLVYPEPVEPLCGPNGEAYALGEFQRAKERKEAPTPLSVAHVAHFQNAMGEREEIRIDDVAKTPLAGLFAPQPVILAGLSPTRDEHYKRCSATLTLEPREQDRVISGQLYSQRCFALHGNAVNVIKQCLDHYDLKTEFPSLTTLDPLRCTEPLNFAALRARAREKLGPPPLQGGTLHDSDTANHRDLWLSKAWKEARSLLPFEPPWVKPEYAPRAHYDCLPVLCSKGSATERNGSPWLDLNTFGLPTTNSERAKKADPYGTYPGRGRPPLPPDFDHEKEVGRRRLAFVDCVPAALLPDKLLPAPLRKRSVRVDAEDAASKKRAAPESSVLPDRAKLKRENETLSCELAMARSLIRELQGNPSVQGDSPLASPHMRAIGL
ncbi:MAG: hypothetical protein CMK83_00765 [Pseudomonadales bacterium]|nr:hypothetical protein [Pseudomonadales bacterium]